MLENSASRTKTRTFIEIPLIIQLGHSRNYRTQETILIPCPDDSALLVVRQNTGKKIKPKKIKENPLKIALQMKAKMEKEKLTQAQLARKLGMTRARVTQILNLLKLAPEIQEHLFPEGADYIYTERALRKIACIESEEEQKRMFSKLQSKVSV